MELEAAFVLDLEVAGVQSHAAGQGLDVALLFAEVVESGDHRVELEPSAADYGDEAGGDQVGRGPAGHAALHGEAGGEFVVRRDDQATLLLLGHHEQ
ncbi:hypothetical protein [Streptomyces finlayi]|uniref:hypothetical protein n=1 Tax=Streptomyces finlayi TaxID=67296 RepID=UPI0016279D3A|nr:hypothetical protein [Streptomyces finlayi]